MSKTGGVILKLLLKQQKTKPSSGRPQSARLGVVFGDRPPAVVGLIAIGQMDDLLAEKGLLVHRRDDGIGDDVIDEIGPHGARKAEEIDLDRGRPRRQDLRCGHVWV